MKKTNYTLSEKWIAVIVFIVCLYFAYGCWRLNRWLNYKYSYESFVTQQIETRVAPLEKRIKTLEERQ